jgi:hypothetical protein
VQKMPATFLIDFTFIRAKSEQNSSLMQEITVAAIRSGDRYHSAPGVADQRRFPGRGGAAKINRSRRRELKQASGGEN